LAELALNPVALWAARSRCLRNPERVRRDRRRLQGPRGRLARSEDVLQRLASRLLGQRNRVKPRLRWGGMALGGWMPDWSVLAV